MDQRIVIPASALVVLIGAAGSGKSTFAQRNFPPEAIVASDALRARRRGSGDRRSNDVFDELQALVDSRLAAGALTVVDATNTDWMRRSELIRSARAYQRPAVAVVLALPLDTCLAQNAARLQSIPRHLVTRQVRDVERDLDRLDLEGFSPIYVLRSSGELAQASVHIEKGPVAPGL
jgi:predicted kinase